jgi:hypothetical protein
LRYAKNDLVRGGVVEPDVDVLRLEHVAELVAHQVVDRLHVELGSEAFLDAVDDRELGRSLLGLLEEALGLVEQAGIFEGNTHARRNRGQEPDFAFAKRILPLVVLDQEIAQHAVAADDRHVDCRKRRVRSGDYRHSGGSHRRAVVEDQRTAAFRSAAR